MPSAPGRPGTAPSANRLVIIVLFSSAGGRIRRRQSFWNYIFDIRLIVLRKSEDEPPIARAASSPSPRSCISARAAKRLNLSQPPLTQHIKALEAELSVTLFHRTKRSVRITDAGTALLDEARRLVSQADGLRQVVQRADKGAAATCARASSPRRCFTETRKLYATMSRGVPGVTVMWQEMNSFEQIEALHEDKIDIAFLHTPAQHPGLTARVIVRDPMVMAVPDGHRLAGRQPRRARRFRPGRFRAAAAAHVADLLRQHHRGLPRRRHQPGDPAAPAAQPAHHPQPRCRSAPASPVVPSTLAAAGFPGVTFMRIKRRSAGERRSRPCGSPTTARRCCARVLQAPRPSLRPRAGSTRSPPRCGAVRTAALAPACLARR